MIAFHFELPHTSHRGGIQYRVLAQDGTPIVERKRYGQWEPVKASAVTRALVLTVLRERVARFKAESYAASMQGDQDRLAQAEMKLDQLREAQNALGVRGDA